MFCRKCGQELSGDARFCPRCGQPQEYTLTIVRANQWYAVNPAIKVVVDTTAEYAIENGATLNVPITLGEHSVVFSCSFRKRAVKINVTGNAALYVKWNRITGSIEVSA